MLLLHLLACDADDPAKTRTGLPDDTLLYEGCRATPLPEESARIVAVSHPYAKNGASSNAWELLSLAHDTLSSTGIRLEMGRGTYGPVVWAPDGSLGVAVQDDGTLGVFTPDGTVVQPAWDEGIYASDVVFDPSGETLWVVDGNWENNGGGVYEVTVDCESGALSLVGKRVESKLGSHLLGDLLVADAKGLPIDLTTGVLGTAVPFFDDPDAIVGGAARRGDTVYVGNNSYYSMVPNTVVVASLENGVTVRTEVEVEDPVAMVAVQGGAIISSGFGDTIVAVNEGGLLQTLHSELPGSIALGPQDLAMVAEVSQIRLLRLEAGKLTEVGAWPTGTMTEMVGSIGVQP